MVNYKTSLQLRTKDPKGTTSAKSKDGQKFKGGRAEKKPKAKSKYTKCFTRATKGGKVYTTCVDTSKAKHYHKTRLKKNTGT